MGLETQATRVESEELDLATGTCGCLGELEEPYEGAARRRWTVGTEGYQYQLRFVWVRNLAVIDEC